MRLNHCHCLSRLGLLLAVTLSLPAQADLSSLFTNLNASHPTVRPRRSSIIFIQCDSLGYLDLSCYGQTKFATPNLDRLAAGGMRFTNYDAGGADGTIASYALLLGRHPEPGKAYLTPDDRSVAQVLKTDELKGEGYHTGLIGEWCFGGPGGGLAPWQKGFDEFAGYYTPEDAENYYAGFMERYAPLSHFNDTTHQFETSNRRTVLSENAVGKHGAYIPDLYTKAALNFIRINHPNAANHYRPFFLWLCYPTPRPNQAEFQRTGNGLQVPTDAPYTDEPWPPAEKNKAAMIARLDGDIGQILDKLKAQGMTNNVAVFFTSATLPRKTAGLDPAFFPSVTSTNDARLPMIAWWPQHIPAGRVSGVHWSPRDVLPTAAAIALAACPTNVEGVSILPALYGRAMTNAPVKN